MLYCFKDGIQYNTRVSFFFKICINVICSCSKIVRTVLFTSERVTGENKEAMFFLLILFCFSLLASGYVLWNWWDDVFISKNQSSRSFHKLLLNCIMIITSVVPPEFPVRLISLLESKKNKSHGLR
jgi:manganese-transporting P-type ATPase